MSSFDIVAEVCAQVEAGLLEADIRVVGGFAAAALLESSAIDPAERLITLGPDADLASTRPNGTRRDLDIMLLNTDPALRKPVLHTAVLASAGRLTISLSQAIAAGTDPGYLRKGKHVFDPANGTQAHRVGPFQARVPDTATDSWRVALDSGAFFAVNDPRFQIASYNGRRLRGIHPKDNQDGKLARLEERVRAIPGMYTEAQNADYAELERLATDIEAFQRMGFLAAARRYGLRSLASKIGSAFLTSPFVTRHYQRAEGAQADKLLRKLQAADANVELSTY
jgi:hypothetical protein